MRLALRRYSIPALPGSWALRQKIHGKYTQGESAPGEPVKLVQ